MGMAVKITLHQKIMSSAFLNQARAEEWKVHWKFITGISIQRKVSVPWLAGMLVRISFCVFWYNTVLFLEQVSSIRVLYPVDIKRLSIMLLFHHLQLKLQCSLNFYSLFLCSPLHYTVTHSQQHPRVTGSVLCAAHPLINVYFSFFFPDAPFLYSSTVWYVVNTLHFPSLTQSSSSTDSRGLTRSYSLVRI